MANHKSATKRARQSETRKKRNLSAKRVLRTLEKKIRSSVDSKDLKDATANFKLFLKKISKATQKGLVHKNRASRKMSQMAQKMNLLQK